jgi:hypothetical protein
MVAVDFAANAIDFVTSDEHASLRRWYDVVSKRPSAAA